MKITQCHISQSLDLFKDGFKSRWNLTDYQSVNDPCLFIGCYSYEDIQRINSHRGFKLILFGGADIPNVRCLQNIQIVVDRFTYEHSLRNHYSGSIKRFIRIPFKDYSQFKPVPLGDKIYCYQSNYTEGGKRKYRYDLLLGVINYFGPDNVLIGYQGNSMETMIDKYYSKSFVNLQLNPIAGFTTALEMAHMGRVSISNYYAPFCFGFNDLSDIIKQIESIKTNNFVANPEGFLHDSDDWLDINFWK